MTSATSAATIIAVDVVTHEEPRSERKQTLGDILQQIEAKIKTLMRFHDFTTAEDTHRPAVPGAPVSLQLGHQCEKETHLQDDGEGNCGDLHSPVQVRAFCGLPATGECARRGPARKEVSVQAKMPPAWPSQSASEAVDSEGGAMGPQPRERKDSITSRTSECPLGGSDRWPFASDALKNLRAAITVMLNATEKSPMLCEERA